MAVYRNVQVNFWQDDFVLDLTPEELSVPMLLAHFGMPGDLAIHDVDPVCEETEEEEVIEEETGSKVFTFYEQHFGSLSPHTVEELSAWMIDLSEELVLKALQIAHENNKRTVAYVKGILRGWHGKGFTKVSEVEADTANFRKKGSSVSTGETENFLAKCEEWEKNAPSEEELQRFLAERGWRP
ncbi:DnaD and phage-associated domain-containing protein [Bacillus cereus BAG6X1-2]|nr:DnaD and phage-associated domain-containing protein [Bacillus cereus BAG6X1-2]